jgi:alanyl-tRNA synthetase
VPAAIAKLRRELQEAREALGQARARAIAERAGELIAGARAAGVTTVAALLDGLDADGLRAAAKRIVAEPDLVALLAAPGEGGVHLLAARGAASSFDCGAFIKRAAAALGGRGGGSPERAEGRAPALDAARWTQLTR